MSTVLDNLHGGFPVALNFGKANAAANTTNTLGLQQGNGFRVPEGYVFHPLVMTAKSNGALTELVTNGGFETAGTGGADVFGTWTEAAGNGAIASEAGAGNFHGGSKSAKLTTGADGLVKVSQDIVTIPGYTYAFTYWVKGDGATNKVRHRIVDKTHAEDILPIASAVYTPTATWQQISVSFTAPTGCVSTTIVLAGAAAEGAICYLDDVSVYPTAIPTHTAVFKVASDGVAPSEGLTTWFDDITRVNEDSAPYGYYPITAGKEITIHMVNTAYYVPVTADIDVVLLGVLVHE